MWRNCESYKAVHTNDSVIKIKVYFISVLAGIQRWHPACSNPLREHCLNLIWPGHRSIWRGEGKRGEVPFDLSKEREAAPYLMLLRQPCLIWTHLSSHVSASGTNLPGRYVSVCVRVLMMRFYIRAIITSDHQKRFCSQCFCNLHCHFCTAYDSVVGTVTTGLMKTTDWCVLIYSFLMSVFSLESVTHLLMRQSACRKLCFFWLNANTTEMS